MEAILSHPYLLETFDALVLGPPYWPEIGTGLAAVLLALWLAYRLGKRAARAEPEEHPPPSPEKVREEEPLYEEAKDILESEPAATEPAPPVVEEVPPEAREAETAPEPVAGEPAAPVEEKPPEAEPAVEAELDLEAAPVEEAPPPEDFFTRLKKGLSRTRNAFVDRVDSLLGGKKLDADVYEELEETLVTSDLGVKTAYKLLEKIQKESDRGRLKNSKAVRELIREEVKTVLESVEEPLNVESARPFVIMVLGVNGVGKTTTIGKLAWRYRKEGKKVLIAAADTFRAAAIDQLAEWARRAGAGIIKHAPDSDPGAVAFDAMKAAVAREVDVVIVDTAGRLHTRAPLMEELKKVQRVIARELEGAPHEVLLVLDATTGQNAISQAQTFNEALGVTGIVMTKLDGTAKGGVIVGISDQFRIPIRMIGIGERLDALMDFQAEPFVDALFK